MKSNLLNNIDKIDLKYLLKSKIFLDKIKMILRGFGRKSSDIIKELKNYVVMFINADDNIQKYMNIYKLVFANKKIIIVSNDIEYIRSNINSGDIIFINTFSLFELVFFNIFPNKIYSKQFKKFLFKISEEFNGFILKNKLNIDGIEVVI